MVYVHTDTKTLKVSDLHGEKTHAGQIINLYLLDSQNDQFIQSFGVARVEKNGSYHAYLSYLGGQTDGKVYAATNA